MNDANLKKTALYGKHIKLNAKMVPFAGWEMPLQYDKIITEHNTVREKAGLFDVSHMGEISIQGNGSLELIQKLVPQDISKMDEGKAIYTQLCNPSGGIIDDLIIYRLNDIDETYNFLLIVNASNTQKDFDWINTNLDDSSNIKILNISDQNSLIALQGPLSVNILNDAGIEIPKQPKRFHVEETILNKFPCIIARTGYTGEDGFEIMVKNEYAPDLWDYIINIGRSYDLIPAGLAARDTLRLEAALPLHGNDIDETITPVEAGLSWSIDTDKTGYIGQETISKQLINGTDRILIGYKVLGQYIARKGCEIFQNGKIIGNTTSGNIAPYLNYPIGMGYVSKNASVIPGDKIEILIRNKKIPAEIVKKPFYKRKKR